MYTIQVVGAGYTGSRIAQFFAAKKQKVFALTRSAEKSKRFESQKIIPIIADLTKPETLSKIPSAHFIVICPAPDRVIFSSAPEAQPLASEQAYEEIYLKGIGNYLQAIKKNPRPSLIVYLSSTGVWQDQSGDFFDETVVPAPVSVKAKILFAAEKQVLNCGLPAVVLRLSGIYGPERNRIRAFREKKWPVDGKDRWMNVMHVDDIVEALPVIFKNGIEGETYLGTDQEPFLMSTLVKWLSEKSGIQNTHSFECNPSGRRLKSEKLKELGVILKHPTFREGYAAIMKAPL